ncbi:hypothetical protein, partial [Serratia marcescens]|uniref:hypothetical protein n=1 Tax=Serratia marcescens TaxID=615 RepID=UPI001EE488E7
MTKVKEMWSASIARFEQRGTSGYLSNSIDLRAACAKSRKAAPPAKPGGVNKSFAGRGRAR